MNRSRLSRLSLLSTALTLALAGFHAASAQDTVRAAVGKPLQAAEAALARGQYAVANKDLNTADAVPGKTPYESFVIQELRGAIAAQSGDYKTAIASYTAQINSPRVPNADKIRLIEAVAGMYFGQKDYANAAIWADRYYKQGGNDPKLREMQVEAHYLSNDCAKAVPMQQAMIDAQIKANQTPTKDEFDLMYSCALQEKSADQETAVLRQEVVYYPSQQFWTNLIENVTNSENFDADRLEFDAGLLQSAVGALTTNAEYMNLIQVALQGDHSGMAAKFYDQGVAAKLLGDGSSSQADVDREKRLKALVDKTVASDKAAEASNIAAAKDNANMAFTLGYNLIDLGNQAQGISMMEDALQKGVTQPDGAHLRMGEAYVEVGRKSDALAQFQMVGGNGGAQELAQLWIAHLNAKGQ